MNKSRPTSARGMWLEYGLAFLILCGLLNTFVFFFSNGYLPQPWFYEPSGTFMDWYSLTIWAHKPGAFEVERTIYPPLSFVIMRIFSFAECYHYTRSEEVRSCDWVGVVFFTALLLVNAVLTFIVMVKLHGRRGWPRAFALSFGLPMLYAYERGNLVLLCYLNVLLAFGPLLRSARLRWLAAGFGVNLKVYLIAAVFAPLLRRRWIATEGMILASVAVYFLTWAVLQDGSPQQLLRNLSDYSSGFSASAVLDLWYPATYIPLITLLKSDFPLNSIVDGRTADTLALVVPLFIHATQGVILSAAVASWLRPEAVAPNRMVYLALALALSASEAGGYTEILLLLFVFMEPWRGLPCKIAIVLAFVLCIPYDYVLGFLPGLLRTSYLSGRDVIAQYGVGVMSLLRPGLVLIIANLLGGATIADVWRDIKQQGWQGRWRFRGDWPLWPGARPPSPPTGQPLPARVEDRSSL
ncbi:hypothetical protein [Silvimonas sp.]|uniref:hypothetical protein n=1 Tax=Silvimonas sp. TaxID=2650811 RepID=UPI0028453E42|nr:hypothetical protein [Silvimonas sp.]MDR3430279.1 hypothetical protein [Silvimonas sp.]